LLGHPPQIVAEEKFLTYNADAPLDLAHARAGESSNLTIALGHLPPDRASAMQVYYRFCRIVDDIADSPFLRKEERMEWLDRWDHALDSDNGLPVQLATVLNEYSVDRSLPKALVAGCRRDVQGVAVESRNDLLGYCWQVACSVGLVSIRLFGCTAPESIRYAEELGYALQITNIIRDVGEDAEAGRIYLPSDMCEGQGVSPQELLLRLPGGGLQNVLGELAHLAISHYDAAASILPRADRAALLPAIVMSRVYRRLLESMQRDGFRVFAKRYRVSSLRKGLILLSARLGLSG